MKVNVALYAAYALIWVAAFASKGATDYQPTNSQKALTQVPHSRTIALPEFDSPIGVISVPSTGAYYVSYSIDVLSYTADGELVAKLHDHKFRCATEEGNAVLSHGYDVEEITPDGTPLWVLKLQFAPHSAICAGERIYAANFQAAYVLSKDGKIVWTWDDPAHHDLMDTLNWIALDADGTVYAGSMYGQLEALDNSGNLLWRSKKAAVPTGPPVPDGKGHIYRADAGHLFAINRTDGQILWQHDLPAGPLNVGGGLPVLAPNGSICYSRLSFFCFDEDGKQRWRFDPDDSAEKFFAPPIFDQQGRAYLFSSAEHGCVYAVSADGRKRWSQKVGDTIHQLEPMSFGPDGWLWFSNGPGFLAFDISHQ